MSVGRRNITAHICFFGFFPIVRIESESSSPELSIQVVNKPVKIMRYKTIIARRCTVRANQ